MSGLGSRRADGTEVPLITVDDACGRPRGTHRYSPGDPAALSDHRGARRKTVRTPIAPSVPDSVQPRILSRLSRDKNP